MTAIRRLALLFAVLLLQGCSEEPYNYSESLRQQINQLELALNQGESDAVLDAVAADFRSEHFPDRRQLSLFMLRQRRQHSRITLRSGPAVIQVQFVSEDQSKAATIITATASFQSLLTGGGGWLPHSGQFYHFVTHWRWRDNAKEGNEWELVEAQWKEVFEPR
ncbi:MAG: hypothetical protein L3J22_01860 [Xanthomonadales bacterium]|nr:hypothetical protein [Xanthomonadales bacterium]